MHVLSSLIPIGDSYPDRADVAFAMGRIDRGGTGAFGEAVAFENLHPGPLLELAEELDRHRCGATQRIAQAGLIAARQLGLQERGINGGNGGEEVDFEVFHHLSESGDHALATVALRRAENYVVAEGPGHEARHQFWSVTSAYDRSAVLRRGAALVRERHEHMAHCMTLDQGKPFAESTLEAKSAADHIEWYAKEGRRAYGRIVPARNPAVRQLVVREPVGAVAAFTPWNFPINQAMRKIAGALAAGCSIIIKAPEEAPGSVIELVRCFHDAGVPKGVLNLVFGIAAEVSDYLIRSPIIRKVSFTGSTEVGRQLGALAAEHLKLSEEPFGPVAPLLRFDDPDSVIRQANSLEYGLAAFAFTASLKTATELGNRLQRGMVSRNHFGLALPNTPFGGIKASGHGSEGGSEGLDAYLTTKFISQVGC
ncbi:hypothetical protein STW0522PSE72_28520 [Pseudomonas monteilii]|nr:hypothetical protein STW0522PSE72_28520 [Pseudomonas monteilii]